MMRVFSILSYGGLVCFALTGLCSCSDSDSDEGATSSEFDGACTADLIVQPSADPANSTYPDPSVSATCEGGELVVQSNGIIGYEYVPLTPNDLAAQDYTWRIPLSPQLADAPSTIPLLGTIGFSLNGLPLFGPNEAEFPDPYGDPVYNGIVDDCKGHTAQGGTYHYHAMVVSCIAGQVSPTEPDPIIGFSLDGFAIYGPRGCLDSDCTEVVEFESGYVQTGDPTTYAWDNHEYRAQDSPTVLDACNGRIGPDGDYRYHATAGFPYILGCYSGVITGANSMVGMTGGDMMMGGDTMVPGACADGRTSMCCGDGVCDGPETAASCPDDC